MEGTTIAGYRLEKVLRRGIATSFKAEKDGKLFFFKLYRYEPDDPVTATKHYEVQERIRVVLDGLGNITEDILEHNVLKGFESDVLLQPDAYFQVKPFLGEAVDLRGWLYDEDGRLADLLASPSSTASHAAGQLFEARRELLVLLAGLLKQCHANKLVHQDLKPEQFLLLPWKDDRRRPVIADFDWSFFEGEPPLRGVGTPGYHSYEHVLGAPRTCVSDVFTFAIMIFETLTLGQNPLLTAAEASVPLSESESLEFLRRCRYSRRLVDILPAGVPGVSFSAAGLRAFDDLLLQVFVPDASARPTMEAVWNVLRSNALIVADAPVIPIKDPDPSPPLPPGSALREKWFRLRPQGFGPSDEQVVQIVENGVYEDRILSRRTAKNQLFQFADDEATPFHKYIDPGTPLVEFRYDGPTTGWMMRVPAEATNGMYLVRDSTSAPISSEFQQVQRGDALVLFHRRTSRKVDVCTLIVSDK